MMRFNAPMITVITLCLLLGNHVNAATLSAIYDLAVTNDPQLGEAEARYKARKEVVTQARAGLLPVVSVGGSTDDNRRTILPNLPAENFNNHAWQARISQPVFRLDSWFQFQQSKNVRAQAKAEFAAAQQDMIVRVAESYFNILEAEDRLVSSKAEKDAVQRQLEQVQQRFDVGLVAITDVLESTAAFDSSAVNVIEAEGAQDVSFQTLLRLTGQSLTEIASLSDDFPVAYPQPRDEEAWVKAALQQNYRLLAASESVKAAERQVQVARSGHYPTVDASVTWGHSVSGSIDFIGSKIEQRTMRLTVNVPVYSGGFTHSRVKEAIFNLEAAQRNFDLSQRTTVEETRSLYTLINTDVGRVQARLKGIESSQSALDATQTGYEVGTRNIVDVLLAQQRLYLAQFQYASAKYKYILDTLRIKQVTGSLSPEDIIELNGFLDPSAPVQKLSSVR